jgi:hypothetical protein
MVTVGKTFAIASSTAVPATHYEESALRKKVFCIDLVYWEMVLTKVLL